MLEIGGEKYQNCLICTHFKVIFWNYFERRRPEEGCGSDHPSCSV